MKRLKWALMIGALGLVSACQPPPSGEPAGLAYPYLYYQLQQQKLSKNLSVPVEGIKPKHIVDTWGAARSEGRTHQGVDIFAQRGTPVLSTTSGIISQVGLDRLGGKVIWVTGPALSRHYYAHLNGYADHIQEGDWVEVGETLGYVGNTGNAKNTPPHLHYGIYLNGIGAVNPYLYLK